MRTTCPLSANSGCCWLAGLLPSRLYVDLKITNPPHPTVLLPLSIDRPPPPVTYSCFSIYLNGVRPLEICGTLYAFYLPAAAAGETDNEPELRIYAHNGALMRAHKNGPRLLAPKPHSSPPGSLFTACDSLFTFSFIH